MLKIPSKTHKSLQLLILLGLLITYTYTHQEHSSHDHNHNQQFQQTILPQAQPSQREPDDTDNMMELSKLIISTIEKYDHTEKGVIPLHNYDQFLHQIFINGNKFNKLSKDNSQVPEDIAFMLRQATKEFKTFRYSKPVVRNDEESKEGEKEEKPQKKQFVELQEFYMDLIKHFSQFLDLEQYKDKYMKVSEYFFMDQQAENESGKSNRSTNSDEEEGNEKLEL